MKLSEIRKLEQYIQRGYKTIDYSNENIEFCNESLYLPYQVNPDEILDYKKELDVCYIGHPWGNYRVDKIQDLKKSVGINVIGEQTESRLLKHWGNKWGKERDEIAFKHKILVNIHHDKEKSVKVIAGKFESTEGFFEQHNVEPIYFDINLNKNKKFNFNLPSTHNSFIYLIEGEIIIGNKSHKKIKDSTLILLTKGKELKVEAITKSKFLFVSGKPIEEQITRGGPFVMNTKAEILEAINDYQSGTFVK